MAIFKSPYNLVLTWNKIVCLAWSGRSRCYGFVWHCVRLESGYGEYIVTRSLVECLEDQHSNLSAQTWTSPTEKYIIPSDTRICIFFYFILRSWARDVCFPLKLVYIIKLNQSTSWSLNDLLRPWEIDSCNYRNVLQAIESRFNPLSVLCRKDK